MFGNLLNNDSIKNLIERKEIEITPIDWKLLQVAQYPLRGKIIYKVISEGDGEEIHIFSDKHNKFILKPKTYYWVDIFESIKLPKGIVGRFIPSSNLIEKGIGLTAGKVEKPFGDNGEKIRFGLFNFLDVETSLSFSDRLAYIQFTDLRGLKNLDYKHTKYDKEVYRKRIAEDDGPNYEADEE